MLGRLLKYDLKSISKALIPLALILAISTAVGCVGIIILCTLGTSEDNATVIVANSIGATMLTVACVAIVAFLFISLFLMLQRFYKSCYTDEGYLTFTLPVTTNQLLLSKYISTIIWTVFALTVAAASAFILILITALVNSSQDWLTFWEYIQSFFGYMWSFEAFLSWAIPAMLGVFAGIMNIFLSITIGAIVAKKHKILAAIGFYYLIGIITSVLTSALTTIVTLADGSFLGGGFNTYSLPLTIANSILMVVLATVAYFICKYMMKNKLNLA